MMKIKLLKIKQASYYYVTGFSLAVLFGIASTHNITFIEVTSTPVEFYHPLPLFPLSPFHPIAPSHPSSYPFNRGSISSDSSPQLGGMLES